MRHETPPTAITLRSDDPVCDFCWAPPYFAYPCNDFVITIEREDLGAVDVNSKGAWLACPECAKLIDAECWDDLFTRAAAAMESRGVTPDAVREAHDMLLKSWHAFHENRKGERIVFG